MITEDGKNEKNSMAFILFFHRRERKKLHNTQNEMRQLISEKIVTAKFIQTDY